MRRGGLLGPTAAVNRIPTPATGLLTSSDLEGREIPCVGILGFALNNLFAPGHVVGRFVEQADCWLGQTAVTPIPASVARAETQRYP